MNFVRHSTYLLGLAALTLGAGAPAAAQEVDIKIGSQEVIQDFFVEEDSAGTAGVVRLGGDDLRLEIGNAAVGSLVRNDNGNVIGVRVDGGIAGSITTEALSPEDCAKVAEEVALECGRKPLVVGHLQGSLEATTQGVEAEIGGAPGEEPTVVKSTRLKEPIKIHLGLVVITLDTHGAITDNNDAVGTAAAVQGKVRFKVDFKNPGIEFGAQGGVNLPKWLGGKGIAAGFVLRIEISPQLKAAILWVYNRIKDAVLKAVRGLKKAGNAIRDAALGYRGPLAKSGADLIDWRVINVAPVTLETAEQVAAHFAPVIYQRTNTTEPEADFIRKVNFDEDFDTTNNFENLHTRAMGADCAAVYYDVKGLEPESDRLFVTYTLYYAQRFGHDFLTRRENDMAGITVVVDKSAAGFQAVEMVMTKKGRTMSFYPGPAGKEWTAKPIQIGNDRHKTQMAQRLGRPRFIDEADHPQADYRQSHPQIWVTKADHDTYLFNGRDDVDVFGTNFLAGDSGVEYHPSLSPRPPVIDASNQTDKVGYELLPLDELLDALRDADSLTRKGKLRGDNGAGKNHAQTPLAWWTGMWGQPRGSMFKDPAATLGALFDMSAGDSGGAIGILNSQQ